MTIEPITNAVRRRITAILFASQSLFSASIIASFTLMPIVAAELGGGDDVAGLPSTLALLARAAAAYPIGWLMDRIGRRFGLATGFFLGVLGLLLAGWGIAIGSFGWFLFGVALSGMGRGSIEQTRYVAAEVHPVERRAKMMGTIVFAGTIGAIAGPMLVAPSSNLMRFWEINEQIGPFLLAALLNFLALILIFVFLRPDPKAISLADEAQQPILDVATHEPVLKRPLRQIFAEPMVLLAVASMAIGQLVMTLIMVITPLHMNHNDHTTSAISFVIMAHTLGMFGLSGVTGWLIDRYGRIIMIVVGSLILVISALLTPISPAVPMLALALFLLGLGWNFCFVAGSSLLSESLVARERGRVQGASEVVVALSSGVGSLGTGFVFAVGGILAISAAGLAFALALVAFTVWSLVTQKTAVSGSRI